MFHEAIRLKPRYAGAYVNLGNALEHKGSLDEAIAAYQEALHLRPDFAEAHYDLGNTLSKKGAWEDAVHSFQEAIHLKPGYADAYTNLGGALKDHGRLDEAIDAFGQTVRCARIPRRPTATSAARSKPRVSFARPWWRCAAATNWAQRTRIGRTLPPSGSSSWSS